MRPFYTSGTKYKEVYLLRVDLIECTKFGKFNITDIALKIYTKRYRHSSGVIEKGWQFLLTD